MIILQAFTHTLYTHTHTHTHTHAHSHTHYDTHTYHTHTHTFTHTDYAHKHAVCTKCKSYSFYVPSYGGWGSYQVSILLFFRNKIR
jgi:hypothetical protein